jgi:transcription initiation factor TFIIE subunit beta
LLLRNNRGFSGMDVNDLMNSYSGVVELIEELAAVGAVLVIRNKDNSPKLVYYNDSTLNVSISEGAFI